jgi:hypothetical protein
MACERLAICDGCRRIAPRPPMRRPRPLIEISELKNSLRREPSARVGSAASGPYIAYSRSLLKGFEAALNHLRWLQSYGAHINHPPKRNFCTTSVFGLMISSLVPVLNSPTCWDGELTIHTKRLKTVHKSAPPTPRRSRRATHTQGLARWLSCLVATLVAHSISPASAKLCPAKASPRNTLHYPSCMP